MRDQGTRGLRFANTPRSLSARDPEGRARVKVIEVAIGGIHLVQKLVSGYNLLVVVDAMERASPPNTVYMLHAELDDPGT